MNSVIKSIVRSTAQQLLALYPNQAEAEHVAWIMVSAITNKSHAQLVATDYMVSNDEKKTLEEWIAQHIHKQMPLQYLLGTVPFCECTILVEPPILIPRPETEEWVFNLGVQLQALYSKNITVLDLCTGSGAIACALAKALRQAEIVATDICQQALALAHKNAKYNSVSIQFVESDLFANLAQKKFDIIVSNPPYVSADEWQHLDPMVSKWEDYKALVADDNGLKIIKDIIKNASYYLRPNKELEQLNIAQLYIEIGHQQGDEVAAFMQRYFSRVRVIKDYNAKDRVVCGFLPQ